LKYGRLFFQQKISEKYLAWCEKGIAGRGILLDYLHWSQAQNKKYDILKNHAITAEDLQACAKAQNVMPREGDILFVRTGFRVGYEALNAEEKKEWAHNSPTLWTGIETSEKIARWLWDNGFAACAGDQPGWEAFPIWTTPDVGGLGDLSLHEVMLGGWGMPIGEFFDLERLSEECARQGRYSFFFTSMPLNVVGGVGSPPSALAIF
jgi:kynurenine formamidase